MSGRARTVIIVLYPVCRIVLAVHEMRMPCVDETAVFLAGKWAAVFLYAMKLMITIKTLPDNLPQNAEN